MKILWTTKNDLSTTLFDDWKILFYEDNPTPEKASIVYFRDPFNSPDYKPDVEKINHIIDFYDDTRSVDDIRCFFDLQSIEDKYNQFLRFGDLMPKTSLPSEIKFETGKHIAKLRISQRAKDILFELDRAIDDNWIIQERMDIDEEIRVYVVNGKIIDTADVKSSKQNGRVKIIGHRIVNSFEKEFIKKVISKIPHLDFVGLDLAILKDKSIKLIEVNRSPQFVGYYSETGINLAKYLHPLKTIGSNTHIEINGIKNVPAKIDTGADSSAVWVSDIEILKNNHLKFKLFGPKSPLYTGEPIETDDYKVVVTRSSHGDEKIFYRTHIPIIINGREINALITLSDRSNNNFPVLIGKRTIRGKFIVDVEKREIVPKKNPKNHHLNRELRKNPYKFHQKYIKNRKRSKK